jgi:zinc transport system substrate-binding protein
LPQVYTVNYPLTYFAERIAGSEVDVIFPAPNDVDPATWSPAAETIASYQQADLVLLNGAGYAGWIGRATLRESRLVDTSAEFADELIPIEDAVTHSHGPDAEHSHQGTAFTTWLDMNFASSQARAVFDGLVRVDPDHEADFRQRLGELEQDLDGIDRRFQDVANRIGGRPILFSHPVYQYLIRRYGLNGRAVHWEPDEMPGGDEWRRLARLLDTHAATWMVWESEPLPETVRRLEGVGVGSVVFTPSANRPLTGDLLSVMRENVAALEQAFSP